MKLYIFTPNKTAIFNQTLEERLRDIFEVVFYTDSKPLSEYRDFINDTEEKIVALDPDFFNWSFSASEIDLMQNVKAICLQTTSFSWIDTKHAGEKGIPVTNLRGFSSEAVAEFALTLALGVARKLPLVIQAGYQQDFVKHQGLELKGKTAGIIGLGRIGTNIANLTKGIGMKTVYWSQNSRNNDFEYRELSDVMSISDVVFLSLAQNDDTQAILTPELISMMRPATMFISTTHQIYDHDLVVRMVQNGKLYGYGYEKDNGNPNDIPGNIYCLPAIAWATQESMEANAEMWIESIILAGQDSYPNRIN
jgi:lactate dehydrogenase-like 2-hydroxyacid dehydrogenase